MKFPFYCPACSEPCTPALSCDKVTPGAFCMKCNLFHTDSGNKQEEGCRHPADSPKATKPQTIKCAHCSTQIEPYRHVIGAGTPNDIYALFLCEPCKDQHYSKLADEIARKNSLWGKLFG